MHMVFNCPRYSGNSCGLSNLFNSSRFVDHIEAINVRRVEKDRTDLNRIGTIDLEPSFYKPLRPLHKRANPSFGLKIPRGSPHEGSIPSSGTIGHKGSSACRQKRPPAGRFAFEGYSQRPRKQDTKKASQVP